MKSNKLFFVGTVDSKEGIFSKKKERHSGDVVTLKNEAPNSFHGVVHDKKEGVAKGIIKK